MRGHSAHLWRRSSTETFQEPGYSTSVPASVRGTARRLSMHPGYESVRCCYPPSGINGATSAFVSGACTFGPPSLPHMACGGICGVGRIREALSRSSCQAPHLSGKSEPRSNSYEGRASVYMEQVSIYGRMMGIVYNAGG